MARSLRKRTFVCAEKCGLMAIAAALLLSWFSPWLAVAPLGLFLLLCFVAPFMPTWGFFLPVISRGNSATGGVALTFDDGPSPFSTPIILELLARYRLPATFFVIGEKAAAYPELVQEIVERGHSIGNHSWRHDYFLMMRTTGRLREDIRKSQDAFRKWSIEPLVFRPPVGITAPRLAVVLAEHDLVTVNYSCRAFDRGNRDIDNLAVRILRRLRPGDIIMLHDLPFNQRTKTEYWMSELDRLLAALAKNHNVVSLEELIGRPVMRILP